MHRHKPPSFSLKLYKLQYYTIIHCIHRLTIHQFTKSLYLSMVCVCSYTGTPIFINLHQICKTVLYDESCLQVFFQWRFSNRDLSNLSKKGCENSISLLVFKLLNYHSTRESNLLQITFSERSEIS